MKATVLYLSYDGALEPLGQSQVLRYLERLATDYRLVLISFEKPDDWKDTTRREATMARMNAVGITWIPLRYHKRPSALVTAWDIAHGVFVGARAVKRYRVGIVHARSYVPSVMALFLKSWFHLKYVFDMRGFWADERVDGGLWARDGQLFQTAKSFERKFLRNADVVVSLTNAAIDEMRTFPYLQGRMPRFELISTCADLELFRPADGLDDESGPSDSSFALGYVGSVGVWYLFDEVLRCFQYLGERIPNASLHVLNRGGHGYIRERLAALGVDQAAVRIEEADHAGVARAMQRMDAGIFFYKPGYSKKATAPTKLGEFLGCGVPCLGNSGVGDVALILEEEGVGVALERFDESSMRQAVERIVQLTKVDGIRARCRDVALRRFSLDKGAESYGRIYSELAGELSDS